jgi:hypothetical protein
MRWRNHVQLGSNSEDMELLLWNIPNEVLNGFRVEHFEERIGASEDEFRRIAERWRSRSEAEILSLDAPEARAFRNALEVTLIELGSEEFQTRTGCDFNKAYLILQDLDYLLAEGESR